MVRLKQHCWKARVEILMNAGLVNVTMRWSMSADKFIRHPLAIKCVHRFVCRMSYRAGCCPFSPINFLVPILGRVSLRCKREGGSHLEVNSNVRLASDQAGGLDTALLRLPAYQTRQSSDTQDRKLCGWGEGGRAFIRGRGR